MPKPRFRSVLKGLLFLGIAFVLWAGWYSAKRGLTRSWRERVFAEFRAQGIEITFKKLTADPLRGFVAREVAVFDANDHQRILAEIDRLTLNIDWSRLLRSRSFVSALELHDARLSLPLDRRDPHSRRVEVDRLHARLLFPEKQVRLVEARARTLGMRVRAEGWISNPAALPDQQSAGPPEWLSAAEKVLRELESIQWHGEAPLLRLQFSGDMNAQESVTASLRLESEAVTVRGYQLDSLNLAVVLRDGVLELQDLALEDRQGRLHAVGRWVPETESFEARIESTLDPLKIAAAAGKPVPQDTLQFLHRPSLQLRLQGSRPPGTELQVSGTINAPPFLFKKERFEGLSAAGSWEKGRWSVRELRLVHTQGSLAGDVLSAPGEFRAKVNSTLPPALWELALENPSADGPLRWLQSEDPVQIEVEAAGSEPDLLACTVWGRVQLGRSLFRGVSVQKVDAPFRCTGGVWNFGPFQVKREEGMGEGSVTYDQVHNDLFVHKVRLRLVPVEAMKMIEPEWLPEVQPYRFRGAPPLIIVDGKAAPHTPDRTNLTVSVETSTGMDYDFAGKTLPFDKISAQLLFTPRRVRINALAGELFHGKVEGNADISPKPDSAPHKASVYITDVDFSALSKLYTGYDDSKGKLNCSFLWKGDDDNGRKVDGNGELTITDGNVFAIPFLGPFSGILNTIVPGLGYSNAHKATASFTVKNGTFHTNNLNIVGLGFSLLGHGDLHFMDDKMQFYARINAHGLPAVMLFPVSKLFEYSADCKLSKPVWKPRILNRGEKPGSEPGETSKGEALKQPAVEAKPEREGSVK